MKRCFLLYFLLLTLMITVSGCRVRVASDQMSAVPSAGAGNEAGNAEGELGKPDDPDSEKNGSDLNLNKNIENNNETKENPESLRKEFDENAFAEIIGGTDRQIHEPGEGDGFAISSGESSLSSSKLKENSEETALLTVPTDEAEESGVSEDGEAAESMLQYYTTLLQDRGRSLFECKRLNVYWETVSDHLTIYKTSPEHQMILWAGSYDVSSRLLRENLQVDDGWVVRKNPDLIVKVVPGNVLGSGVTSLENAETMKLEIQSREGWSGISAVREGRILLLSEELLTEPYLQLGAMLALAKKANPDLYEDVDPEKALESLILEATGTTSDGIFIM